MCPFFHELPPFLKQITSPTAATYRLEETGVMSSCRKVSVDRTAVQPSACHSNGVHSFELRKGATGVRGGDSAGRGISDLKRTRAFQESPFTTFARVIFQKAPYALGPCRRPIKMSPLCQIEMTLPGDFPEGVWGDGTADERWRAWAA